MSNFISESMDLLTYIRYQIDIVMSLVNDKFQYCSTDDEVISYLRSNYFRKGYEDIIYLTKALSEVENIHAYPLIDYKNKSLILKECS